MDPVHAKEEAKRLVRDSVFRGNWSKATLEIWLRDECRCVYCGRDMLQNRDTAYYFSCPEHLLPVKTHPDLQNEVWNQVLSCTACNLLKHTFDPSSDGIPPDEEHKVELIERGWVYIQSRRTETEKLFEQEKRLLTDALGGDLKTAAANAK